MGSLFGRIILGIENGGFVAKLLGAIPGGIGQNDEPRVIEGRDDDGDSGFSSGDRCGIRFSRIARGLWFASQESETENESEAAAKRIKTVHGLHSTRFT